VRVAALYDIHGNLPALDAVLDEIRGSGVDRIVVGGDATLGPMPRDTMARLLALEFPVEFIHGNCELAMLAQMAAPDADSATYWGSASGNPPPEPTRSRLRWAAEQVRGHEAMLASWPRTIRLVIEGLGEVVFCHSTPRSETEIFTRLTAEEKLAPIFDTLGASVVVCGHTHMQFDRMIGRTRVVNAGSVGMPIGQTGAFWIWLGPGVELRRTTYNLPHTADLIRATGYPEADDAARTILEPPAEAAILEAYSKAELR
jgi:predicted phosphodiesterase